MIFRKDLTNQTYGFWTVLEFDQERSDKEKRTYWKCQCECGTIASVLGYNLTSGTSRSCGCQSHNLRKNDLVGQVFGYLTVIEDTKKLTKGRNVIWKCKCKCGNEVEVPAGYLIKGSTSSCGCYKKETSMKDLTGKRFGKLVVLEETDQRLRDYIVWKCQCDCGNICYITSWCLNNGHTNSCGCLKSKGEAKIKNILDSYNIPYNTEHTFADLISINGAHLRFDFAILNSDNTISHLIEYNGQQHYECSEQWWNTQDNFSTLQQNDLLKQQYCKKNNIDLIIIPYDEYDNITIEKLLGDKYERKNATID